MTRDRIAIIAAEIEQQMIDDGTNAARIAAEIEQQQIDDAGPSVATGRYITADEASKGIVPVGTGCVVNIPPVDDDDSDDDSTIDDPGVPATATTCHCKSLLNGHEPGCAAAKQL